MITINKAILHILDFNSDIAVFSQVELGLDNEIIIDFLSKHIEKTLLDSNQKNGLFFSESKMKNSLSEYLSKELNFLDLSMFVAENMYREISKSDKIYSTDLLICDFSMDDLNYFGILMFENRIAYTHQVKKTGDLIKNEIIRHYAILPNVSQRIDAYAFVDLKNFEIRFSDKKRFIDGKDIYILPDVILQCSSSISSKDTLKIVNHIANKIAEEYGCNSAIVGSKIKNYIVENSELSDTLEPLELGKEVFYDNPIIQNKFSAEVQKAGLPDSIKLDKSFAIRTGRSHKIKTDTGIEVTFPADYFENHNYIQFINNPDGTISIELKNIGKIINR